MSLTNLQIINLALDQAGLDSSFQTKARTWMNHVLDKLSNRQDYKEYNLQTDLVFVPGQREYTLPSDYQRADTCYMYQTNDEQRGQDILIVDSYLFDRYKVSASGNPSIALADIQQSKLIFNTIPNDGTKGARLRYFRNPTVIATDSTDDANIPDFNDQATLLNELEVLGLEYMKDPSAQAKRMEARDNNRAYQRNMYNDNSFSKVNLESNTFRPTSRRSYNNRRGF